MTDSKSRPSRWAIIVGINYYPSDRCLQGSVQDAVMVKHYLEESHTPIDVTVLTATTPSNPDVHCPVETPEAWPTSANVVSAIRRVLESAQPGDLVYFHYSGHGARIPGSADPNQSDDGELALVLFENDSVGSRYLPGRHLASALRRMVGNGLLVTLVLDCCFSGSVVRHGDCYGYDIRCFEYNADIGFCDPKIPGDNIFEMTGASRDGQIEKDWLINPKGYTILSACGPYERAYEVTIAGYGRRGALTHFLLSTMRVLETNELRITQQTLHEHLRAKFHASWPQQNPMRYGNSSLSFFGDLITSPERPYTSVFKTSDGRVHIRSGRAHGINKGDEFSVTPLIESPRASSHLPALKIVMKAEVVRSFESELVVADSKNTNQATIQTGWKAKPISSKARTVRVRVTENINNERRWQAAAHYSRYLYITTEPENEPCFFQVITNDKNEYEVVDALSEEIRGLPKVPVTSSDAIGKMVTVLDHLATFIFFERIENRLPSESFQKLFSIRHLCDSGQDGSFVVMDGSIWGFTIENVSEHPLYLAVYDFTPAWEIVNLVSNTGGDGYLVVPPKEKGVNGRKRVRLQMKVPEFLRVNGTERCQEVVKVFVTSKPVSFPTRVLSKINLGTESELSCDRGGNNLDFMLRLPTFRNDEVEGGHWVTQNFIVQTILTGAGQL